MLEETTLQRTPQWREVVSFTVPGIPKPAGSKRAFALRRRDGSFIMRPNGTPIINVTDDAGEKGRDWKRNVTFFGRQAFGPRTPLPGALRVVVVFNVARPKGHFRSGRNAHVLRDGAPHYPTTKPDATKLWRGTEDALTGVLFLDDAQIVEQHISKRYAPTLGAEITLYVLE